MKKYKFTFTNAEATRAHLRTWQGRANINVSATIKAGFIELYSHNPDTTAARLGGASYVAL